MKASHLKLLLKTIISEAKLLENIQDPTKEEMFNYLQSLFGKEEGFRDDAEVAIYWFANFYHGGQSSNLYSVLSTSRFNPGPIARGPQKGSMEELMYESLVIEFARKSKKADEIQRKLQRKNNSLNEAYEQESKLRKQVYDALKKEGFEQKGSTPNDYVEFYISGFATVSCVVNVYENYIFFDRYYDSERVDSMEGHHIEKKVRLTGDPQKDTDTAKKVIAIVIKLKKSIEGDESLFGGIDDISENEFDGKTIPKHNAKVSPQELAEANKIAKQIWGNGVTAEFHSIDRLGGKHFHAKSFGGHPVNKTGYLCKEKSGKWIYSVGEGENSRWVAITEGDEADAVNDMWAGSDDDLKGHDIVPPTSKQKSKQFFHTKKVPAKTVQDIDWTRVKNKIDRGTLAETDAGTEDPKDAMYVEYVAPWGTSSPFTLQTINGKEKFEFCKAKYPDGTEDIAVYAYRGDLCYGFNYWKRHYAPTAKPGKI